ncbi:hypothetical protein J4E80_009213 [Alternaria sp. BMP 0032]|nr:hypothetical protein J4E80_009213 [Alternaria sp. BMP 0032]
MAPTQAEKSRKISEEIGRQYKDKNFRWPKDYTPAEAAEFAKIRERTFAKREKLRSKDRDTQPSPDDIYKDDGELLENALQTAVCIEKYWLWVHKQDMIRRTMPEPGTAKDYIDTLAKTDYVDDRSLGKLYKRLSSYFYPCIPIGTHHGYRYAVSPCMLILGPDEEKVNWDDPREFASEGFIAIDLPAGTRISYTNPARERSARLQDNSSEESRFSSSSTHSMVQGNGHTGFACFTIGKVQAVDAKHWSDDGKLPEGKDLQEIHWEETDWVMVVVIDDDGKPGSVWLLQDFEPMIENTNNIYIIEQSNTHGWGYFQHQLDMRPRPQQLAGVKIANRVSDLSEDLKWTMDEYITAKYEIVQAVLAERKNGRSPVIVRQLPLDRDEGQNWMENSSGTLEDDSTPELSRLRI